MLNKRDLLSALSSTTTKSRVLELAESGKLLIPELLKLSMSKSAPMAFRAAWVLENIEVCYPESFISHYESFIQLYPLQQNNSCKRHYTKIMMSVTSSKRRNVYGSLLRKTNLDDVVEASFIWLSNPETPVAVQVNCMDILFNLKDRYDWIAAELKSFTEFLLRDASAAAQSRGKTILRKLK